MKNITSFKRMAAAALLVMVATLQAEAYNNLYLKVEAYPTGAGKVYVSQYADDEVKDYQDISEIKNTVQMSTVFVSAQPAEGYLFAGCKRDRNGNRVYDEATDEQVFVRDYNGMFEAEWDEHQFEATEHNEAKNALADLTEPTDYVFAVFTKGAVARVTTDKDSSGQPIQNGQVFASKLDNTVGDVVTFSAQASNGFHFVSWTNAVGEVISTQKAYTLTVQGPQIVYANFAKGSEEDGIENVNADDSRTDKPLYDLQGRRHQVATKGLYLCGGKKFIAK